MQQALKNSTCALVLCAVWAMPGFAQTVTVTAGSNMEIDFNEEVPVSYSGFGGFYSFGVNLIHDPGAGPMIKRFESPITDTFQRILLNAQQPFPQRIWEQFHLVPGTPGNPGGPPISMPVSDWHEEILTEGWEWVLPGDSRFTNLFPPNESLITKNGQPHPWQFPLRPAVHEPNKLWVEFPPISPGDTLEIHKALLWVGTPGNQTWGDDALDDGTFFNETVISVFEYPTPEPTTLTLLALGAIGLLRRR